jgi:uncharacterized protein (DUF2147 family)
MKKRYILLALLMTSTAAHAGNSVSFEINGHRIHIEAPRNCDSLSCLQISAPGLSTSDFGFKTGKSTGTRDDDDVAPRSDAPAQTAAVAPALASTAPTPSVSDDVAPAAVTAASPANQPAVAAAPVQAPTTPLGVWATEENKGLVRVEQCGQNLCGYAVKTGEKILIDMKPSNAKWTGQIHDPDSGKNYDSNIAMKGPNALRVQGCAFGGMFCGGQTWSRVS